MRRSAERVPLAPPLRPARADAPAAPGTFCGLISWGSHSTIVHSVSKTGMQGPYVKQGVAVWPE